MSFFSSITGLIGLLMPGLWFGDYDWEQDGTDKGKEIQFNLCLW